VLIDFLFFRLVRSVSASEQRRQSSVDRREEEYAVPNVFETKVRTEQLGFQPPGSSRGEYFRDSESTKEHRCRV
jgi:hypothetical protein